MFIFKQYVGKSQSVVSLFSLDSLEVKVLDKFPEDYTPGQVNISKDIKKNKKIISALHSFKAFVVQK